MKRDGLIANCAFYLADLGGKQNLSGISALPRKRRILAGGADVTLSRYLACTPGETASPLSAHNMQGFVAGHSVAYAFISEEQRAGPAIDRTSEEGSCHEALWNRRDELHPSQCLRKIR